MNFLLNYSPKTYTGRDKFFPADKTSIQILENEKELPGWIKMHFLRILLYLEKQFKQGNQKNCYFLSAVASLANIHNGEIIKNIFITQKYNAKNVYIIRWHLEGKAQFVSVNDWIPAKNGKPMMGNISSSHYFWGIILEKAYAKLHRKYQKIQSGFPTEVWEAITQAPTGIILKFSIFPY